MQSTRLLTMQTANIWWLNVLDNVDFEPEFGPLFQRRSVMPMSVLCYKNITTAHYTPVRNSCQVLRNQLTPLCRVLVPSRSQYVNRWRRGNRKDTEVAWPHFKNERTSFRAPCATSNIPAAPAVRPRLAARRLRPSDCRMSSAVCRQQCLAVWKVWLFKFIVH